MWLLLSNENSFVKKGLVYLYNVTDNKITLHYFSGTLLTLNSQLLWNKENSVFSDGNKLLKNTEIIWWKFWVHNSWIFMNIIIFNLFIHSLCIYSCACMLLCSVVNIAKAECTRVSLYGFPHLFHLFFLLLPRAGALLVWMFCHMK